MKRKPEWKMVRRLVTTGQYHAVYRDDALGVQLEVITKRRNGIPAGKGKSYFYMDGNDYEFTNEEKMLEALNNRNENAKRLKKSTAP